MGALIKLILFLTIIGIAKAAHRLLLLALIGLAALYMLHVLARDYETINKQWQNAQRFAKALFSRRSFNDSEYDTPSKQFFNIDWSEILDKDPAGCARSFICQLAAKESKTLHKIEMRILNFIRHSFQTENWGSKELKAALTRGEKSKSLTYCQRIYNLCPYSSKTMLTLLNFFGGT